MAISNGFDDTRVINSAKNRIGFRNGISEYAILNSDNQISNSGRYYQDFHSSVTLANLRSTSEYAIMTDTQFNDYLASLKVSVIRTAINSVFSRVAEIDKPRMLFDRIPSTNYLPIANDNRFVGIHIKIAKGFYAASINSVDVLFDGDVEFNLYLFQDGVKNPLKTKSITSKANEISHVDLSEWVISAVSTSNYYIGYFQSDLGSVKALDVSRHNRQCFNVIGHQGMSAEMDGVDNFIRTRIEFSEQSFGLNFEISTYKDYTNELVKNIHLFDNLFGLQMAIKVIEQAQYTTRSNVDERAISENAQRMDRDLNMSATPFPETPFTAGLREQYNREASRVYRTFFQKSELTSAYSCDDIDD